MVILPVPLRPPVLLIGASKLFSGLLPVDNSLNELPTLKRVPGVIGLNFLTGIFINLSRSVLYFLLDISQTKYLRRNQLFLPLQG